MRLSIVSVLLFLIVSCAAQSTRRETHYITTHQTTLFKVHLDSTERTGVAIDSVLDCRHEITLFVWSPEQVFLVDELGDSTVWQMVDMVQPGIYILADGTAVYTVLHMHRDSTHEEGSVIYFQKGMYIKRIASYNQSCEEL